METDIQTLEQQLEEMRATYQLNTEKLEYNYRVLTERDMENSATLSQQKRKLARLKDALTNQIQKYHSQDSEHKAENQLLTEDYRRITKQYKDLQNKFRHFEVADNETYQEVWNMHKEESAGLVERVLKADEIIHSQLLGLNWQPPTTDVFARVPKGMAQQAQGGEKTQEETEEAKKQAEEEANKAPVSTYKVKIMLQLLAQEAGFLIDAETREKLEQLSKADRKVAKADSILAALGIESEKDVEKLLSYFFTKTREVDGDSDDDEGENGGLKVKPDEVVRVVKKFIVDREDQRRDDPAMQLQAATMAEKAAAAQRQRRRKEERQFWSRIANVVPPKTHRAWSALEKMQVKYVNILKDRAAAINETQNLKSQKWLAWTIYGNQNTLPSGETITEAFDVISDLECDAYLINCGGANLITEGIKELKPLTNKPIGGYGNSEIIEISKKDRSDRPEEDHWSSATAINEKEYAKEALIWVQEGATIIAGCCRTRPSHIAEISKTLKN